LTTGPWRFGVAPLDQTRRLAPLLRAVAGLALSLEQADPAVDRLVDELTRAERSLGEVVPADPAPRVGPDPSGAGRVYIDHSEDIGSFNPFFPEYTIAVAGARATGSVSFPVAYEGPPGLVHGGFLAVFFDCVIQDHNCELGQAGKTTALHVDYLRPTPILTRLDFEVERSASGRRILSTSHISHEGVTLCRAAMEAATGDRSKLPAVSPRRAEPGAEHRSGT
jgi:acyl-coenzyme A thioesterase PaaI-like protein